MKTQLSQAIRDVAGRYSGVYEQQGRMITDADWNALTEIVKARLEGALADVIGTGTPAAGGAVQASGGSVSFRWGTLYVDGIPARLRPRDGDASTPFDYTRQLDLPDAPARPAAPFVLYADVWERAVNALEDAALRDAALHGADTTTRTETMAQVKWGPAGFDPEDPAQNPPVGTAHLTASIRAGSAERDPCDPCADEIELSADVGNYLFRVEVHDVHYAADGHAERVTLKWSRENGAEIAYVGAEPPGFVADRWVYEFHHGAPEDARSERHLGYFAPAVLAGWSPARGELSEGYPATPPNDFSLVRRWDGYCELVKAGAAWALNVVDGQAVGVDRGQRLSTSSAADAHGHVDEGATVGLGLDTLMLAIELADHALLAGDFWSAAVRTAVHQAGDVVLDAALPDGIRHHYMTIAQVDPESGVTLYSDAACRRFGFPQLTDLHADDVCFDALSCEMPGVRTVQQAIDHLCRERDLRFHNRHLHGWGIVCGLVAECGPDTLPTDAEGGEPARRQIRVTQGYALDSHGRDIVLDDARTDDVLALIEAHDAAAVAAGQPAILANGKGVASVVLDRDANGDPVLRVEPYVAAANVITDVLQGTLAGDFWEHCVGDLVKALKEELSFLDPSEIADGESPTSISTGRRKLTAVINLVIQLINQQNGSFVFLSHDEHRTLAELYLSLRTLLQSKTYCAMFEGEDFPAYPFPNAGMDTIVGKGTHLRTLLHPDGVRLYTYGGPGQAIHVYDVARKRLVDVVDVPAASGAEVTALAFSADGNTLYVAANIRGKDTLYGRADVRRAHRFERMTVLCDVLVSDMAVDPKDDAVVYAIGRGRGLFRLLTKLLEDDEAESSLEPLYAFRATGQVRFEFERRLAVATARSTAAIGVDVYDQVVVLDLAAAGEAVNRVPTQTHTLRDAAGTLVAGDQDIEVRFHRSDAPRLYAIVGSSKRRLLTYEARDGVLRCVAGLDVEATQIRLAFHADEDALLLAMEDGYRVQVVGANGEEVQSFRTPVQIAPQHLVIGRKGEVYVLNLILGLTNTISVIPREELRVNLAALLLLAKYRVEILKRFYGLAGHVLQYLKDCLCHHLLVKCPQPKESDRIYLASVDVRESQVFNVCNFAKRRYVKSFPTVDYWMSIVPVLPMLREAVMRACCAVLPERFAKAQDKFVAAAPATVEPAATNRVSAKVLREAGQTYTRTDRRTLVAEEAKNARVFGGIARDALITRYQPANALVGGVRKEALVGTDVQTASEELKRGGIDVAEVRTYDAAASGSYLQAYTGTPPRVAVGSKVTLYERDGKVAFYAVEQPSASVSLDPALGDRIAELEARKAAVSDLAAAQGGLEALAQQKNAAAAEVTALQRQVESLREVRAAEEARFAALAAQRDTLSAGIAQLGDNLRLLSAQQAQLRVELARDQPVRAVDGVSSEVDIALRDAGIRSVGELADATPERLKAVVEARPGVNANALIDAARLRLK